MEHLEYRRASPKAQWVLNIMGVLLKAPENIFFLLMEVKFRNI